VQRLRMGIGGRIGLGARMAGGDGRAQVQIVRMEKRAVIATLFFGGNMKATKINIFSVLFLQHALAACLSIATENYA
jgi:hypothetical protein